MTSVRCLRDSGGFWFAAPGTSNTVCLDFIFDLALKKKQKTSINIKKPSKMELCSFLEEIKDQNFRFYNINEVEIQTQNIYFVYK